MALNGLLCADVPPLRNYSLSNLTLTHTMCTHIHRGWPSRWPPGSTA